MREAMPIKAELAALASYLAQRREALLQRWHQSVAADPELTTASAISRTQFNDHIPQLLEAFERRLQAQDPIDKDLAFAEQKRGAAEHGLHRWQQGYNQRQTIREWGHLQLSVLTELDDYAQAHPELQATLMPIARRSLVRLCGEGVCESATRYELLQQTEAASRMHELQQALQQLQSLDRQRAETWREAAHDLRGTVGVISNASAILSREAEADPSRTQISQILQRSVNTLRGLLTDLMDLARLEAGQEQRYVRDFDAAQLLFDYCENVRPLASLRNLFLKAEGPRGLSVQGDSVKVLRIAQNLVLNALKVTQHGGVVVQWDARDADGVAQWTLSIQDTGPGFLPNAPSAPLRRALRHATDEVHELDQSADAHSESASAADSAATLPSQSGAPTRGTQEGSHELGGEGIGLSIVKRLCELLDASLELETAPGSGTTFRVVFPRAYPP